MAHYSPVSGRLVEGFDADEPYGGEGDGGFDSSVLNRPWIPHGHTYSQYAYNPKCKLLVNGRGYLYDPERMDWLRIERLRLPYTFGWDSTVLKASPHGAVAWAKRGNGADSGLWLFDREKGWVDLEPKGSPGVASFDSRGMVFDSKRDRMVFSGAGSAYGKISNGGLGAFDFRTKAVEAITPGNIELNKTTNGRELAYVDHADWMLTGDLYVQGDAKTGQRYTRVYDCAKNKCFLLDAGLVADGYSVGWMYDPKRKLVYAFTTQGQAWAMKVNPPPPSCWNGRNEPRRESICGGDPMKRKRTWRIAAAQIRVDSDDVELNALAVCEAIERAAACNADFLVTPEMALTGYHGRIDQANRDSSVRRIRRAAGEAGVTVMLGCGDRRGGRVYNEVLILGGDGRIIGRRAKMVPTRTDRRWCSPGTRLRVFRDRGLTFGCLICNDLWVTPGCGPYPDPRLTWQLSRRGARVVFHSVFSGESKRHIPFHESNLSLRAREGRLFIATANAARKQGVNCASGW